MLVRDVGEVHSPDTVALGTGSRAGAAVYLTLLPQTPPEVVAAVQCGELSTRGSEKGFGPDCFHWSSAASHFRQARMN